MFSEIKTLRVDEQALKTQKEEILNAILKLINEKISVMRNFYKFNFSYRSDQSLRDKTKIAEVYNIQFYNCENKEILGNLRILIKNIEETKNVE
jgi:hypothetical protein